MLVFFDIASDNNTMRYEPGEPTKLIFDTPDELQAIEWAASEVHRATPDDTYAQSAFQTAQYAGKARLKDGPEKYMVTFHGEAAETLLSVVERWVEAGPPEEKGDVFDPARAKSYRTACAIVAKTVEPPLDNTHVSSLNTSTNPS